ncbi:hypothetical protein Mp_8g03320 [Marchantia polymorpha subsp. ruderalis]|uniref:Uncharacterized protein n=1 Tax=Marchantia polymorpha TaxID=3197 RepID=A0A2R6XJ92_MARPO|nr:hypothetical protein MARPO_0012s0123 [Marchantia polymorpha]BBN18542.1 hypothetical protein Mp_8g03320 [Marchantia polymorpha subsp. ruderalis]|eukprot:PTQ46184.1 hypothetical protein MARPO_0012s0123 [Marchantia polymorpha]
MICTRAECLFGEFTNMSRGLFGMVTVLQPLHCADDAEIWCVFGHQTRSHDHFRFARITVSPILRRDCVPRVFGRLSAAASFMHRVCCLSGNYVSSSAVWMKPDAMLGSVESIGYL